MNDRRDTQGITANNVAHPRVVVHTATVVKPSSLSMARVGKTDLPNVAGDSGGSNLQTSASHANAQKRATEAGIINWL